MRSTEVARRYAEALYELAAEADELDRVRDAFRDVVRDVREMPQLAQVLAHPMVLREKKMAVVEDVFPEVPGVLANLLRLVIRNRRETYLDLIYDEFLAAEAEAQGIARVRVTTASELADEDRSRLIDRLTEALGRQVSLEEHVEEELLGGARLETDGKVIDGTLKARLDRLRSLLGG